MRDCVEEAIIEDNLTDPVLATLIELAIIELEEKRYSFPSPLEEPLFWRRHFKKWVKEAIEVRRETNEAFSKALSRNTGKGVF